MRVSWEMEPSEAHCWSTWVRFLAGEERGGRKEGRVGDESPEVMFYTIAQWADEYKGMIGQYWAKEKSVCSI
jgi:hypothetical protein